VNRRAPWTWTAEGVVLDRELDGDLEQVWVSPHLPSEKERVWYPLMVEFICGFGDVDEVNGGLRAFWRAFGRDSVLVAVRLSNGTCRIFVYTAALQSAVDSRYLAVRGVLRPIGMGLRVVREPGWDSLADLLSSLEPPSAAPRVGDSDPPGALR